jgi:pilus assembly protein Flp/PilA
MLQLILHYLHKEDGATAVEYGVMVALIIALCIGAVGFIGQDVLAAFTAVANALPGGAPAGG